MGRPGPAPRPALQVVREGNPGKRPIREGVKLPPAELAEPAWEQTFPRVVVGAAPKPLDPEATEREQDRHEKAVEGYEARLLRQREATRARLIARREWRRSIPVLEKTAGLSVVDQAVLHDLCICVARIDQCERDISRNGIWVPGERGAQKNPSTTAAAAYRQQLKTYVGELGLSPSSRTRLTPPEDDSDGDDVFD